MVIRYSIQELTAIGEMVILKECISNAQKNDNKNFPEKFLQFVQECQKLNQSMENSQDQLTSPVAEFFKRARQNFYPSTSVDPTKVRRLSEVEAEIVRGRGGDVC